MEPKRKYAVDPIARAWASLAMVYVLMEVIDRNHGDALLYRMADSIGLFAFVVMAFYWLFVCIRYKQYWPW